ncbi:hypothetical protein CLG96_05845 [Sphingomonas oleivorans]|uniref:DUF4238 domain-containing protein n=1 Tax=Sphingomonas oleivorans TaxID=1735121 RepID=A0A2T5FZF9_9SPHN|nr:DUF4238 domain-containing protein [Sphingomonas oleivorans]PTQ12089.1 hypothetical protein CLG96_05845 [Sphingomonas oleivorans]
MAANNPPVKHHYTPQFLLAQWAVTDRKLWRFSRPYGDKIAVKQVSTAEIGYQPHLYALPGVSPEKMQIFEEKFMSPLDAQAAETHSLLLKGKIQGMPQKQRSAWSRFIMSQWFRTPEGVTAFKSAMTHLLTQPDSELRIRYREEWKEGMPATLEELLVRSTPHIVEQKALELMFTMMDNPQHGLSLNRMHWLIRETEGGREFLVSDALLQQSQGVFTPTGFITMPIASRKLFIAVNSRSLRDSFLTLSRNELVARANRAVVRRASEYVGTTDLSQRPFIEREFGKEVNETIFKGIAARYATGA